MTEPLYKAGDIVLARPNWPNKPAYGIWTSDTELVTVGKPARISDIRGQYGDRITYSAQFDRKGDGSFYDCHWPLEQSEIVELIEAA